ncbi:putative heme d1 biosynthesis radical SAM protein NirJ1 [Clostridium beijerinckii]|jgi:Predicted Fe-S oxidoreductases|uniref:Mycofactocin maturase MftC n=2 Tax=Clostridium beijerinckii TaxID=1520 RepID=A0AAE2RVC1_CLOBE|nr:putative heme d1 biosynthesis radical SAM protein NirJ1 [Clostridium beijerinckii]ABR34177.1 Radical SAM domain protein [Clostridium beijerinckii NCIMB 8052]AIU03499.1 radical SAM domain-containing protein [Clostridium beijerinckii ATCC 35702]MBF7811216.1 putative heme d1 biosynthesis radical SAM protein NirJ1 [Clostridium beijerinckii]NRT24521.1 putative heme d1 biosynthesis radical SAM protein NirJ1 [Clostridium beijerinckii]NRT67886.1 putative heme d1 biosynthesis radical SAM protein Nir
MISITKLLCNSNNYGDSLRYVEGAAIEKYGVSPGRGPVVAWNCTKTCNLKCKHCYASSDNKRYDDELTLDESKKFIDDLKDFNVPALLFSGGEPLMKENILELLDYASQRKIRSTISTNGTLLDKDVCKSLKKINLGYVGVSLDGIGSNHDAFRGVNGAFDSALRGIRNCIEVDQKVGLRFTINKNNYKELEDIFKLIKEEKIPRVCFYHLVYSGRGSKMVDEDISKEETRQALDLIISKAIEFGPSVEILTVDNHADAVYTYLKSLEKFKDKSDNILKLLKTNGGNRSGMAFANVDFFGNVHPDQFTWQHTFGNVKEEKFGSIWRNSENEILNGLRNRKKLLKGRCSSCKWLNVCNGNFRTRAEAVHNDFWAEDPACYLTDDEINIMK